MSAVQLDRSLYPIIIVRAEHKVFLDQDLFDYLDTMEKLYTEEEGNGIVVIYDLSLMKLITSEHRKKVGEWLDKMRHKIEKAVKGVCYVQTSPLHGLVLKGIFAVSKPSWNTKVVKSLDDGIKWANELLSND